MYKQGLAQFKYYVGIRSLDQVATRDDRVCVLNILGGESSLVTPIGHEYSGGNVVFGTSPGRGGQVLETKIGNIPVYNSVLEGMKAGHRFNCGVVYLPPSGVRDGVAELIRVNPELRKIFIVTEKVAVRDAREIRALGQLNGIDIFGANSLGVVDTWNEVRIGGALGGDAPGEALKPGSIAILANSGNFTSTIATYLRIAGWGTTTLISSGKDVYIHYAAPEFAYAMANDDRTKAAVLYAEPGGYYEQEAHFTKPVVACVVGRWKSRLTRAVGHAGAMAGGADDAESKERWFMEKFDVTSAFTPERPVFSKQGALVTNIAHIPAALTAVMRANGVEPDFAPEGGLELKPWFGTNPGVPLPAELDIPVIDAAPPYNRQIADLNKQIGAAFPRQPMKDASGVSQMDVKTQVTSLHGLSMLEASRFPLEANVCLALTSETGGENNWKLASVAVGAELNLHDTVVLAAAQAARDAGNAPNSVMAAACSIIGPLQVRAARVAAEVLIDLFAHAGLQDASDESFPIEKVNIDAGQLRALTSERRNSKADALLAALDERGAQSVFIRFLKSLDAHPSSDAVLAAITTTLAWGPLMRKRISRTTACDLPWWIRLFGVALGASVPAPLHEAEAFCGLPMREALGARSLTEIACAALVGTDVKPADLFAFQTLAGLLLTNGPGTISAQGAKGATSADGPEDPARIQINKAMVGFLTHTGYAHGGNGFEGVKFLLEQFGEHELADPGDPAHGIDIKAMATAYALRYADYKAAKKSAGSPDMQKIPGVNHPVFKDKPVNHDPREKYVRELLAERGEYNIFHEYYHALVQALFDQGVSRTVYCVNIDAVIAALLLKMMWVPYRQGTLSVGAMETGAFTIFLYGRMLGCAAEIEDHLNRGRNMDMRTPASSCQFVA
jgi:succinyl-CoA synthetase alpha subunit